MYTSIHFSFRAIIFFRSNRYKNAKLKRIVHVHVSRVQVEIF